MEDAPHVPQSTSSVILFYLYVQLPSPEKEVAWQRALCTQLKLVGRILIAAEGINGTLSGSPRAITEYTKAMSQHPHFSATQFKHSAAAVHSPLFPDLKCQVVKELISTAGKIDFHMAPGGVHLPADRFDQMLREAGVDKGTGSDIVVLDVRNDNEYAVGHFKGALNPKTRAFSEWTKYLERFPDGGLFQGKNYVFDGRITMSPADSKEADVVGRCIPCGQPFDRLSGDRVCTVCRDPILVCDKCQLELKGEYHCQTHAHLQKVYFTFLDVFTVDELKVQAQGLQQLLDGLLDGGKRFKNRRRTLRKQLLRVQGRVTELENGTAQVVSREVAGIRCRTCGSADCVWGTCWGFWKATHAD